jgi:hypothetical protein
MATASFKRPMIGKDTTASLTSIIVAIAARASTVIKHSARYWQAEDHPSEVS